MWSKIAIETIGGLAVFLFGMRLMSQGLESVGGNKMRQLLQKMTSNPFTAVLTGFLVTCVIQSSSATTVMMVGFVHAGFLNLVQAIGVVMGANIGTTITGWLVALLGFKIKISNFALPAISLGVIAIFMGTGRRRGLWGEVLVGFGLLFLGLSLMKNGVKPLRSSEEVRNLLVYFSASKGFFGIVMSVGVGALLTVVIQSSSATMALTMTLAQAGAIDYPTALALILGENIGTTITANIAAIGTTIPARRAARAHFLFNLFGTTWAVLLFIPFIGLVDWLIPGIPSVAKNIPSHMAAFHTIFNVTNTLICIPLIGILAKLVTKLIPGESDSEDRHIKYLDAKIISTPALALTTARQELNRMSETSSQMFSDVMSLFEHPEEPNKELVKKILKKEDTIDELERELVLYLSELSKHQLTGETSAEVSNLMHISHNIEKIGDYNEGLLRLIRRKYSKKLEFSESANAELKKLVAKVSQFLTLIQDSLKDEELNIMDQATELEEFIDKKRAELRKKHTQRLIDGNCDVLAGLLYIDFLTNLEKIGDHAYNIAEYVSEKR